jgi:hypothetical protein
MRIIQIARKLQKTPSEIVEFVNELGIVTDRGFNSRLNEEQIERVAKHFDVDLLDQYTEENEISVKEESELAEDALPIENDTDESNPLDIIEQETEIKIENPALDDSPEAVETNAEEEEKDLEMEDEVEVIRPQLIKLEGVKVVGKIDLPAPKPKKEVDEQPSGENEDKVEKEPKKTTTKKRSYSDRKKSKKIRRDDRPALTYEEKVKRQEERKIRKQKAEYKKQKEKKFKHYYTNVQSKLQAESPKSKPKTKEITENKIENKPSHRNPLRKFWAWLNGEYDNF